MSKLRGISHPRTAGERASLQKHIAGCRYPRQTACTYELDIADCEGYRRLKS